MTTRAETLATTLAELPYANAARWGERPAFRVKTAGTWRDTSYAENRDVVDEIARGVIALGVRRGDRVCILSNTRIEWAQVAAGAHAAGATVVPIYPSSSPEECEWVIGNSGAVAVFCENDAQTAKVDAVAERLPELEHVVTIDAGTTDRTSLAQVRALGAERDTADVARRVAEVRPDDIALIIYTSGTTGRSKGCVLSHENIMATNRATRAIGLFSDGDVAYLYLPLAHIFAQTTLPVISEVGGVVAFVSGGTDRIVPDLAEVRPHYVPSVPRIFEKLYAAVTAGVPADVLERGLAAVAQLQADGETSESGQTRAAAAAVAPVLDAARAIFGGRVRVAITGAAPISADILRFFFAAGVRCTRVTDSANPPASGR